MASLLHEPIWIAPDGARMRMLCASREYEAGLNYYPPGVQHRRHAHKRAHASFLLTGGFAEEGEGRDAMPLGARQAYKPEGAQHRVDFGWSGALILSLEFVEGSPLGSAPTDWLPSSTRQGELTKLLFQRIAEPDDVVGDLVAGLSLGAETEAPRHTPIWVRCAAEQMIDDPLADIADVAAAAGVHRVHLSRAFQKYLGLSPTQFRLQAKAARALRHLVDEGASPGEAAVAAGFADQAHWNRTSRALSGFAPGQIKRLMAA